MIVELCVLVAAALGGNGSVSHVERLIAAPTAERGSVQKQIGKAGKVLGVNGDGFLHVRLENNLGGRAVINALKRTWPVFEPAAQSIQKDSLPSTIRHIAYLKARATLNGITDPEAAGVDFYEALEYYLAPRVGPDGQLDKEAIERAVAHRDQMPKAYIPQDSIGGQTPSGSASFSYVGPKKLGVPYNQYFGAPPTAGRVNGIAYAPSNPEIVYLATAGGGVWRSTNGGDNWSFMSGNTSSWPYLHTTSVDVHPTDENIVLVGTGDYYGFFQAQTQGIKRSTDGGTTWTTVGSAQFGNNIVTRVMFHPDNGNIVLALTAGATGDIWRSTDAGVTWTATNAPAGKWDDIDFGVLSGGSRALWAVGGNNEAGGRIYRSTNLGSTWTAVTEPTATTQGIMDVAVSKLVAGKAWVLCQGDNKMFRTTNSGTSWTDLNLTSDPGFPNGYSGNPSYNWSQDSYDIYVGCSEFEGTEYLFCGLITVAVSTDNGNNWYDLTDSFSSTAAYAHVDQHCFEPKPGSGSTVLLGSDGGVQRWKDLPAPDGWYHWMLNGDLYNTQFYHLSVHPTNSNYVMGGIQDNATPASRGDLAAWDNLYAGDGGWSAFNPNSPNVHYTTSQFGTVYKYTTSTSHSPFEVSLGGWTSSNFIAPLVFAANGANLLLGADRKVMRFVSGSWSGSNGLMSEANTLAVGISNSVRVYAGCNDGGVWRSDDGGITFTMISAGLPSARIGGIACAWASSTDVIVGLQRPTGGLYRCSDTTKATPTWTSVSGTGSTALPASPINCVMRDPYNDGTWYVGTDVGAFMTTDYGTTWANMNPLGIGNVHVNAFAIPPDKSSLYVATFGRGIWSIPIKSVTFTSLSVSAASVYGDKSLTGTITLSDPAPPGTIAKITDGNAYVTVPAEVTVTKGSTTKAFTITTTQNLGASSTATVYVTCLGKLRSVSFAVLPYPSVYTLIMNPTEVKGGSPSTATATLTSAAPFTGTISFVDYSVYANAPGLATIVAGATSRSVTVPTILTFTTQLAVISASYKGTMRTTVLTINP